MTRARSFYPSRMGAPPVAGFIAVVANVRSLVDTATVAGLPPMRCSRPAWVSDDATASRVGGAQTRDGP